MIDVMERRKSIARRRPILVYRVECFEEDGRQLLRLAAWRGDETTGRMTGPKLYENAWLFEDEPIRGVWFDNRDTDAIHDLPANLRDVVWAVDDALRQ